LIDFLESLLFPESERSITNHYALGISLGGHATWSCLFNEPRITAGVVIVGGPDYLNLMADRARLSKLPSWIESDPPGSKFLGSKDFPHSLLAAVRKYDPASTLLSQTHNPATDAVFKSGPLPDPSDEDKERLRPILFQRLGGKRILQISGGSDKLVPYRVFEPILTWLKKAFAPEGWFADGGVHFEDLIFEKATHQFTPAMMNEVLRFLAETMTASDNASTNVAVVREAKI
jgi:pimeloyl-ACP methyl ester carboxylesterase